MSFSNRLKEARLNKNLTLQDVSKVIDKSDATIQRYESGAIKTIKTDTVEKLAELLEVSPAYLMGWDNVNISKDIHATLSKHDNYETLIHYFKICSMRFDNIIYRICEERFFDENIKLQLLEDLSDILLNYKLLIEDILNSTLIWYKNSDKLISLNSEVSPHKKYNDIKLDFYKNELENKIQNMNAFISSIPLRLSNVKEINLKESSIETMAAHKANPTQDIKNIDGLKDLLREIAREELGK